MNLYSQIVHFIRESKPGDTILLSKDGDVEKRSGLVLLHLCGQFQICHDEIQVCRYLKPPCNAPFRAVIPPDVLKDILFYAHMNELELAYTNPEPDPEPTIGHQLMQRCYRRGMSEHEARSLIRDLLGDLATWLDQRHGGSSQTADLLRAIQP